MVFRGLLAFCFASFFAGSCHAGFTIFSIAENGGLSGFLSLSGSLSTIDFDAIDDGSNISGNTYAGVTFNKVGSSAELIVVDGNSTITPAGEFSGVVDANTNRLLPTTGNRVLSPGGRILSAGSNPAVENDDLELVFSTPVRALGFDLLSQSADGGSFVSIAVFNQSNVQLYSGTIPISNLQPGGGDPGGADFFGVIGTGSDRIGRIVIDERDSNSSFPDSNVGFDTFRFSSVPEPSILSICGLMTLGLLARKRQSS